MSLPVLAADVALLATGAVWAFMTVMCFWIWQRSKAATNWLMLIGALAIACYGILRGFGIGFEGLGWVSVIGAALVTVGYYLQVKPTVDARFAEIKARRQAAAAASASLPPAPPPPSVRRP